MLHARLNLITADPVLLGESVRYIESEVRPAVERLPGNLGMSLLANPESGVAVLESFWVSHNALLDSENAVATARGEMARRVKGPLTAECYRIPVFEREAPLRGGEGIRLTGGNGRLPRRAVVRRSGVGASDQRDCVAGPGCAGRQSERRRCGPGHWRRYGGLRDPRG